MPRQKKETKQTNHWLRFHSEWYGVCRNDCTTGTDTSYSTWTLLFGLAAELMFDAFPTPPSGIPVGIRAVCCNDGFDVEKLRNILYCGAGISDIKSKCSIIFSLHAHTHTQNTNNVLIMLREWFFFLVHFFPKTKNPITYLYKSTNSQYIITFYPLKRHTHRRKNKNTNDCRDGCSSTNRNWPMALGKANFFHSVAL